ncbi:FG-GAP repeat domain-containing protein [Streptomyces armeniacus]|nr:VCBS repeat-containing protein [Streptomyces armeniacus]
MTYRKARTACRRAAVGGAVLLLAAVTACSGGEGDEDSGGSGGPPPAGGPPSAGGPPRKDLGVPDGQADFDRDGHADAAFVVTGSAPSDLQRGYGPIAVFRGGDGGLRPTGRPLVAGSGRKDSNGFLAEGYARPLAADFDGDGYSDVVAHRYLPLPDNERNGRRGSHTVLLRGGPKGLGERPVRVDVPGDRAEDPFDAEAAGDVNGDGHPDLIDPGNLPRVVYGPFAPSGEPASVQTLDGGSGTSESFSGEPVAADFDRDGDTDILLLNASEEEYEGDEPPVPAKFFRGTEDGPVLDKGLTERLGEDIGTWSSGPGPRAGTDLDGDRYPDILPPGQGDKRTRTYLRGGPDGVRAGTATLTTGDDVGEPLLAGDVTGDGRPELVSTVPYGSYGNRGRIQVARLGDGPGIHPFQHVGLDTPGVPGDAFRSDIGKRDHFADRLQLLDADGDGHTDVLAAEDITGPQHRYGGFWYFRGGPDGLSTDGVRRFSLPELGLSPD